MKNALSFSIYAMILIAISQFSMGCASAKQGRWLGEHSQKLAKAAQANISTADKLDILAESYTRMMHQSLNFANPKKGLLFAREYSRQNKDNIESILRDIGAWKENMGPLEVIAFGLQMTQKPYIQDFINLFPRFQRKFQTYSTIMNLSGKIGKGLLGLGVSQLDNILKK